MAFQVDRKSRRRIAVQSAIPISVVCGFLSCDKMVRFKFGFVTRRKNPRFAGSVTTVLDPD
jgi:hypothetical protein